MILLTKQDPKRENRREGRNGVGSEEVICEEQKVLIRYMELKSKNYEELNKPYRGKQILTHERKDKMRQ